MNIFGEIKEFNEFTRTAQEAANQLNCEVAQIAKSIIFKAEDGKPVLVVASGVNRIDTLKIEKLLGQKLGKADADFVKNETGFVIGGVPPFGHKSEIKTYIDIDLKKYSVLWAAAGKNNAVFKTSFEELVAKSDGEAAEVRL